MKRAMEKARKIMALESIREAEDAKLQRTQSAVSSSDPDLKNDTGDDAGEDSVLIDAPYISQLGTYPTGMPASRFQR